MVLVNQMRRNIVQALVTATQSKLDQWGQQIKQAMQTTNQSLTAYEEKKQGLIPQLLEAREKGVSLRELAKITGISHTTIARWLKAAKKQKENQNVNTN
jgi:response regulator of citrate/malate metabolism